VPRERAPHPWNTGFEWGLPDRAPAAITAKQRAQFDRDGFFVLQGAFDADELSEVEAACDEAVELVAGGVAPGDVVLVKASRAAGLERLALALTEVPA